MALTQWDVGLGYQDLIATGIKDAKKPINPVTTKIEFQEIKSYYLNLSWAKLTKYVSEYD